MASGLVCGFSCVVGLLLFRLQDTLSVRLEMWESDAMPCRNDCLWGLSWSLSLERRWHCMGLSYHWSSYRDCLVDINQTFDLTLFIISIWMLKKVRVKGKIDSWDWIYLTIKSRGSISVLFSNTFDLMETEPVICFCHLSNTHYQLVTLLSYLWVLHKNGALSFGDGEDPVSALIAMNFDFDASV